MSRNLDLYVAEHTGDGKSFFQLRRLVLTQASAVIGQEDRNIDFGVSGSRIEHPVLKLLGYRLDCRDLILCVRDSMCF
jgi:hypothetical protein